MNDASTFSKPFGVAVIIAALLVPLWIRTPYMMGVVHFALVFAILTLGFNFTQGLSGRISLGHVGFWAIGAYATGLLTGLSDWPPILALVVGVVVASVLAVVLASLTNALKAFYLALATLGFGEIVRIVAINWIEVTKGSSGIIGIPFFEVPGFIADTEIKRYYLLLGVTALAAWLTRRFIKTKAGRDTFAMRQSEVAAESLGIRTSLVKTTTLVLSAIYAAVAGSLYAHTVNFISPDVFSFRMMLMVLAMLVVGGPGTVYGPIVGALLVTMLPEWFRFGDSYWLLLFGIALLLVMLKMPAGLIGFCRQLEQALLRYFSRHAGEQGGLSREDEFMPREGQLGGGRVRGPARGGSRPVGEAAPPILEVHGAKLSYGGVKALDDVDIVVEPSVIHAIIGPNGAGKTTLLNVCSGVSRQDSGRVILRGQNVALRPASLVSRAGLARTFQSVQLFTQASVYENVLVGATAQAPIGLLSGMFRTPRARRVEEEANARAEECLEFVGLKERANDAAASLPFGSQRLLEIARALATNPVVLLLDEPGVGFNTQEKERLADFLRKIRDRGVSVVLVEHDMPLVMGVADVVSVLNFGLKIAEGTPDEVANDPHVIDAYLGKEDEVA